MNTIVTSAADAPRPAPAAAPAAGSSPPASVPCSHSIGNRLSKKLGIFTIVVIGLLSWAAWMGVKMMIIERNEQELRVRCELIADLLTLEAQAGGEDAVLARLRNDAPMRGHSRVEVFRANGQLLFADHSTPVLSVSQHTQTHDFKIDAPSLPGGLLKARYTADFTGDARMGTRWAWVLALVTLGAGGIVAVGAQWHVRRELRPLRQLAAQTRAISPQRLHHRLELTDPAEELRPWIDQFNALMGRLEQAYAQLEGFNADVAHELRTPLATLIGQTEVALSRERSGESLRDTLVSNLEEMQRLTAMVNDMLFLSQADRGAVARRGGPVSLAELAQQVVEFHEAPLEEAGLTLQIEGDAQVAVDEPLFKRALSNLLGNATRFAEPGSTVRVRIGPEAALGVAAADPSDKSDTSAPDAAGQVAVVVQNAGPSIDEGQLPRLFDRFFRADSSRCCDGGEQHHGLGLAIVAAIARMHAGRTLAESRGGVTRIGFTLAGA